MGTVSLMKPLFLVRLKASPLPHPHPAPQKRREKHRYTISISCKYFLAWIQTLVGPWTIYITRCNLAMLFCSIVTYPASATTHTQPRRCLPYAKIRLVSLRSSPPTVHFFSPQYRKIATLIYCKHDNTQSDESRRGTGVLNPIAITIKRNNRRGRGGRLAGTG